MSASTGVGPRGHGLGFGMRACGVGGEGSRGAEVLPAALAAEQADVGDHVCCYCFKGPHAHHEIFGDARLQLLLVPAGERGVRACG